MPPTAAGQKCWTGYACAASMEIDGVEQAFVVVAMNKQVAAAVCEHVSDLEMDYDLCKAVYLRPVANTAPPIDDKASELYAARCPVAPAWDQLGEATKSAWRERVLLGEHADEQPRPRRRGLF